MDYYILLIVYNMSISLDILIIASLFQHNFSVGAVDVLMVNDT